MTIEDAKYSMFEKDERAILSEILKDEGSEDAGNTGEQAPEVIQTPDESAPAAQAEPTQTAAAPETTPAPEVQPAEPAPPQGDQRAALRASRRAEKRLRDQMAELQRENEALKQGKAPVNTQITDEELAELDADFPVQAKIVRKQRELDEQLARASSAAPQPSQEFEPMSYDPTVQEVIDGVPDLVAWQYDPAAQDKFQRAIEYDKALTVDPDWKDRSVTDRFAEAARRTKAALTTSNTPTPSLAAPAAPRKDPAAVLANAPVAGPKGISDFRGGAPATSQSVSYAGMSDEQIMASLPVI